jgi:diguanylate cyclase (GGDEF)-like protein/PAS domain S-box-containing protein
LAENSLDVILHLRRGSIAWVSPSLQESLGWSPDDWIGRTMDAYVHPVDLPLFERNRTMLTAGKPVISRYRVIAQDGGVHWIEMHAKPYLTATGVPDGIVASFRTIDPEVHAEEELTRRARYDDLTGVLKRDEILARLTDVSSRRRSPGEECGVLFIDVDGFKLVNDTLGHATGDAVLATLATRIRSCIRGGDTIARMGGDEFLVILNDIHGIDEARAVAEKIRLAAARPIEAPGVSAHVTVSVGVTLSHPVEGVDDVIARADEAMYAAKQAGRDQVAALL